MHGIVTTFLPMFYPGPHKRISDETVRSSGQCQARNEESGAKTCLDWAGGPQLDSTEVSEVIIVCGR